MFDAFPVLVRSRGQASEFFTTDAGHVSGKCATFIVVLAIN